MNTEMQGDPNDTFNRAVIRTAQAISLGADCEESFLIRVAAEMFLRDESPPVSNEECSNGRTSFSMYVPPR